MVNVEPYEYQRKTNLKEHNDLVDKINEIVNVINNEELEGIGSRLDRIDSTDALQWKDIESIKTKNAEQDDKLADNTKVLAGVIDSSVSDVAIMNGTTSGNIKVRIERENAPSIDSDDYNIQKPTSVELVQGSAPAMVKAQITLSDGTVLISDDFMFTTESIGQDVYISSFVFKNGNVAGTISADIGLSNGTTLEANNFVVPTDPNVTNSITDLQNRMTAVESADVGELATLKTTVAEHTVAITALDNDVADMMISKADIENYRQDIKTGSVHAFGLNLKTGTVDAIHTDFCAIYAPERESGVLDTSKPIRVQRSYYNDFSSEYITETLGNVALIDDSGNPKNFTGGEVWEEVDLNNWATDWISGETIKIDFKTSPHQTPPYITTANSLSSIIEIFINNINAAASLSTPINIKFINNVLYSVALERADFNHFNSEDKSLFLLYCGTVSGERQSTLIDKDNITSFIRKIWRKRA